MARSRPQEKGHSSEKFSMTGNAEGPENSSTTLGPCALDSCYSNCDPQLVSVAPGSLLKCRISGLRLCHLKKIPWQFACTLKFDKTCFRVSVCNFGCTLEAPRKLKNTCSSLPEPSGDSMEQNLGNTACDGSQLVFSWHTVNCF